MDSVISTYIYEIKKGTKPLALVTVPINMADKCIDKIIKNNLFYCLQKVNNKINIFFGNNVCIELAKGLIQKDLSKLSPHEDFILGIMLGYNRIEQCSRYLNKQNLHPIG